MLRVSSLYILMVLGFLSFDSLSAQTRDAVWTSNATLQNVQKRTMEGLGAMQGVSFHDGRVYLYGDVWGAKPRVGVIREYTRD
jgi:hypothetical protein